MCMSCNKAKVQQSSSKGKVSSGVSGRRVSVSSTNSNQYGKPKVRFSGRGR